MQEATRYLRSNEAVFRRELSSPSSSSDSTFESVTCTRPGARAMLHWPQRLDHPTPNIHAHALTPTPPACSPPPAMHCPHTRRLGDECLRRYQAGEDAFEISRALGMPPSKLVRIVLEVRTRRDVPPLAATRHTSGLESASPHQVRQLRQETRRPPQRPLARKSPQGTVQLPRKAIAAILREPSSLRALLQPRQATGATDSGPARDVAEAASAVVVLSGNVTVERLVWDIERSSAVVSASALRSENTSRRLVVSLAHPLGSATCSSA